MDFTQITQSVLSYFPIPSDLKRSLERPVANLHDVQALGSGVDLQGTCGTAGRAHDATQAVEHRDGLALSARNYDVDRLAATGRASVEEESPLQ